MSCFSVEAATRGIILSLVEKYSNDCEKYSTWAIYPDCRNEGSWISKKRKQKRNRPCIDANTQYSPSTLYHHNIVMSTTTTKTTKTTIITTKTTKATSTTQMSTFYLYFLFYSTSVGTNTSKTSIY